MNAEQQFIFDRVRVEDGCWLWKNYISQRGYGQAGGTALARKYKKRGAHQLSYIVFVGPIEEGLVIRHKCRNRHCCNPDHLEVGTTLDNMNDRRRDGTASVNAGGKHGLSKLTDSQVIEMRALYASGNYKQKDLAEKYGVSGPVVSAIVNNKTWTHLL